MTETFADERTVVGSFEEYGWVEALGLKYSGYRLCMPVTGGIETAKVFVLLTSCP